MSIGIAGQLSKGIGHLRDGGTVDEFVAQADMSSLSSAEQDELQALLEQSATLLELVQLPVPRPGGKAANRARFLNAVVKQRKLSRPRTARGWQADYSRLWRGLARVAVSLAFLLLLGVGAVSASVDSLPGSPLYRVKLATEDLRLALAAEDPTRAELYMRFANQRGDEIVRLATLGRSADETMLSRMAWQWEGALEHAELAAGALGPRLLADVFETSRRQGEHLRRVSAEAISETQLGLNAGAVIAEQTSREAQEAMRRINMLPTTPTPVSTAVATPTSGMTAAVIVPSASNTRTPTASQTALLTPASGAPKTATSTPAPDPEHSPAPSITPSRSATPRPAATHTAVSTSEATSTRLPRTPTPSNTPLPSATPAATFALTLADTPDPVPATYRIHYALCVVNEGDVPLTNVVVTDSWSPRECVYYLPGNPGELTWTLGTVEPHSRSCRAFDLNTYSICGGRTVTNAAVMTCDQGTAGAVEHTRIIGTPTPEATPTMPATVALTPTGTCTATSTPMSTPTPTGAPTATLTPMSTPTPTGAPTATLTPMSTHTPTGAPIATLTPMSTLTVTPALSATGTLANS